VKRSTRNLHFVWLFSLSGRTHKETQQQARAEHCQRTPMPSASA